MAPPNGGFITRRQQLPPNRRENHIGRRIGKSHRKAGLPADPLAQSALHD